MDLEYRVLGSGSKGNCSILKYDGKLLMFDAGFSGKRLKERFADAQLDPNDVIAIVVSHEHGDHIQGLRIFSNTFGIPVYTNSLTGERLIHMKKKPDKLTRFNNGAPFQLGPFEIEAFSISHDAIDPVGFVVNAGGKKLGVATDFGHVGKMLPLKLRDCDALMLESNYDPDLLRKSERPAHLKHRIMGRRGHLSNDNSAELVEQIVGIMTRHVVIGHLSEDCNCNNIARETMQASLDNLKRSDIELTVATQGEVSNPLVF